MQVRVKEIGPGLHPSETVIEVDTIQGPEQLVVDKRSLTRNVIEVGQPVGENGKYRLVELPAETSSGKWRVWVNESMMSDGELEAAE